jgi:hypothetical protein
LVPTSIFSDRTGNWYQDPGWKDCVGQVHPYRTISCHYENFPSRGRPGVGVQEDDGIKIEPTFYVPIIPMVLVNSSIGIGTGFSTCIPSFDPLDVLDNARRYALSEELQPMTPKYRGFKGAITAIPDDNGNVQKWSSSGIKRRVTERPSRSSNFLSGRGRKTTRRSWRQKSLKWCTQSCGLTLHRDRRQLHFRYATAQDATDAMAGDTLRLTTEPKLYA